MNPTFKRGLVPDVDQPVTIYMPKEAAGIFVANEEALRYNYLESTLGTEAAASKAQPVAQPKPASTPARTHTVRSGESLGVIARRYGISVTELKRWNGLRSDMIRAGQKLVVHQGPKA
jgi:membrane-bound lytic murein transglycosylase D